MQPEQIARKFSAYCNMSGELYEDSAFDQDAWAAAYFDSFIKGQGIQRHTPWGLTWSMSYREYPVFYPWWKEIIFFLVQRWYKPVRSYQDKTWACRGTTFATEIGKETDGSSEA